VKLSKLKPAKDRPKTKKLRTEEEERIAFKEKAIKLLELHYWFKDR
jgi:hypothetical protein